MDNDQDPKIPIAEVYAKTMDLFQDKSRWIQGYYQVDKNGNRCPWREGYAFDVLGALLFLSGGFSHRSQCCLQRISEHLYDEVIQAVNDGPDGYEKIMFALQLAKELWTGYEPTDEELGMPVMKLLTKRMLAE